MASGRSASNKDAHYEKNEFGAYVRPPLWWATIIIVFVVYLAGRFFLALPSERLASPRPRHSPPRNGSRMPAGDMRIARSPGAQLERNGSLQDQLHS
jgi:hypothetical protein